jgi:PIN domain nuclease of toxin-antitoxin system
MTRGAFLEHLPNHHRDPFERRLMAQATVEELSLISVDEVFDTYTVRRLW